MTNPPPAESGQAQPTAPLPPPPPLPPTAAASEAQPGPQYGGYGLGSQVPRIQPPPPPWSQRQEAVPAARGIGSAFDFTFRSYATPGIVKLLYILGFVLGAFAYIVHAVFWFSLGGYVNAITNPFGGGGDGNPFTILGVLALLFGWIPVVFAILGLRVGLEFALSSVRTASDIQILRERSDADIR
ncbi:MAG: DUF4282 domain-containing protein [Beutenbergiaceae bacterium]